MKRLFIFSMFLIATAKAQSDFVKSGSIGQLTVQSMNCDFSEFSHPPINCWVGQKVLFLPQSADTQKDGYQLFKSAGSESLGVAYNELVGKVGTITKIEEGDVGKDVTIIIDDNKKPYIGEAVSYEGNYTLEGIVFLKELQDAKKSLKNKTVWLFSNFLNQYNKKTGKVTYISVKAFRPVYVEDVVAGWLSSNPVRLIVKTENGVEGFQDIIYSGVNSGSLREIFPFEKTVYTSDPRLTYAWSPKIWTAIENGTVIPGMTKQQVQFFLLQNHYTKKTLTEDDIIEQWVFEDVAVVTFLNGVVKSFIILNK